jgi:hypothetical protein
MMNILSDPASSRVEAGTLVERDDIIPERVDDDVDFPDARATE